MATAKKAAKASTPTRTAAPAKSSSQPAATPSAKADTRPASKAKVADSAKTATKLGKPKKPKLVRDSFTIPKVEYVVLEELKKRAARSGTPAKKSEVLRAGLKVLAGMEDAAFIAALGAVPALKTGRPAKS